MAKFVKKDIAFAAILLNKIILLSTWNSNDKFSSAVPVTPKYFTKLTVFMSLSSSFVKSL